MITSLFKFIGSAIVSLGLLFGGQQAQTFGTVANTSPTGGVPAVFETYLASQQAIGDTTLTLASGALRDGTALSGYTCFTIDSNTSTLEYECGTVSGTSVTGLLRGIDSTTGTTSVSALIFAHRRGADVKITDYPALTIATNQLSGTQTIPNPLVYTTHPIFTSGTQIVDKSYVDSGVLAGAATSSETTTGIVRLATKLQMASSTDTSPNTPLVLYTKYSTSSPNSLCALCIPITQNDGTINPAYFIATSSLYTYNWGAAHVFQASTTIIANSSNKLSLNGQSYAFPAYQTASSTILATNGSGTLNWVYPTISTVRMNNNENLTSTAVSSTTLLTIAIPANTLDAVASRLSIHSTWNSTIVTSGCTGEILFGNGSATSTLDSVQLNSLTLTTFDASITASSTSSENITGNVYPGGTAIVPFFTYSNKSITGQTYLAFVAKTGSTNDTCKLVDTDVKVYKN